MASNYLVDNSELSLLIIYLNNSYFLINYMIVHASCLLNILYTCSAINLKPQNRSIYTKYIQEAGKINNIILQVIPTIQGQRASQCRGLLSDIVRERKIRVLFGRVGYID